MSNCINFGLTKYSHSKYSQYYEDGMILEVLETLNSEKNGFFVDVGSWDGVYLSNCFNLVENNNYRGICIEADGDKFSDLEKNMSNFPVKTLLSFITTNQSTNLNKLLSENDCPKEFDLLSIDIDGNDYWIWESLTDYHPKVVIMEYNGNHNNSSVMPYEENYVHIDNIDYYGATPPALNYLAELKGYTLVGMNCLNMIFVRNDLNKSQKLDLNSVNWYKRWANQTDKKMNIINNG